MDATIERQYSHARAEKAEAARSWILFAALILAAIGLVMVFSTNSAHALNKVGLGRYSLPFRQIIYLVVAAGIGFLVYHAKPAFFYRRSGWFFWIAVAMLVLVFVPGIGVGHRGRQGWLWLGFTEIQPSEFAKIALVLYLSAYFARIQKEGKTASFFHWGSATLFLGSLVLIERHIGMAALMIVTGFCIALFARVNKRQLALLAGILVFCAVVAIKLDGSKLRRITDFYSNGGMMAHRRDTGYQSYQALLAVSSGGLTGRGLGRSVIKYNFLPDNHTDFIFAITAEELGLPLSLLIVGCFLVLVIKATAVGRQLQHPFQRYAVCGLATLIGIQSMVNIAMNCAWIPAIGLPLPLMSYGGSSTVSAGIIIALILNQSKLPTKSIRRSKSWARAS